MRAFGISSVHLDAEADLARIHAYNEYIEAVRPALPSSVVALLGVSVHDAHVAEWALDGDGIAQLAFITENVVENISLITLRFSGASVRANETDDVSSLRLLDGSTELLSSEFDVVGDRTYRYQILVSPTGELAITFTDVEIERAPATMEQYLRLACRPDTGRWGAWADAWLTSRPLHRAAALGQTDEIVRLIDAGHSPDEVDQESGGTALHSAAIRVQVASMKALLAHGADIDRLDSLGESALSIAAGDEDDRGVEYLLSVGADVFAGSDDLPLASAASTGTVRSLRRLLDAGADPHHRDSNGWTALMHAAEAGHPGAIEVLIAAGADPTERSNDGRSAADVARGLPQSAMQRLLLTE